MNKTSRNYFLLAFLFLAILVFTYCNKSFGQDLSKPITRGLLPTSRIDTTKPTINHRYVLKGSDTMFILLQNLILSPDDVTPRQKNIVMDWFRQNVKIDSTKK